MLHSAERLLKLLLIFTLLSGIFLLVYKPALPAPSLIFDQIKNSEPRQEATTATEITREFNGFTYKITPLYAYQIEGLVVSGYDAESWFDFVHQRDPANKKDLCLVWGKNITSDVYRDIRFWSGEFTCFYQLPRDFNKIFTDSYVSNNHLIPATPTIAKLLQTVNLGDQVSLTGYLSTYEVFENGEFVSHRGTSTVREDSGNGACETIYLTGLKIYEPASPLYYLAKKNIWYLALGILLLLIAVTITRMKKEVAIRKNE